MKRLSTFAKIQICSWIALGGICGVQAFPHDSSWRALDMLSCELMVDWQHTAQDKTVYLVDAFGQPMADASAEARIVVEHIYPNVDLMIYPIRGNRVRYEFTVYPGGSPADVLLTCSQEAVRGQEAFPLAFQDQGGIDDLQVEATLGKANDYLTLDLGRYDQSRPVVVFFEATLSNSWNPSEWLQRIQ